MDKKESKQRKEFEKFFLQHLIYCEDTHSFTHRLYDKIKETGIENMEKIRGYVFAQELANQVLEEMYKEHKGGK